MPVRIALVSLALGGCMELYSGPEQEVPPGELACPAPRPGCPSLAACDAGECLDVPSFDCDPTIGQWVENGTVCEGPWFDVRGDLLLEQSVVATEGACSPYRVRRPLRLSAENDGSVTAAPPVVIVEGAADGGWGDSGTVRVTLDDDWSGIAPRVEYELVVYGGGHVEGSATAMATDCDLELDVSGALCPHGVEQCTVYDDGWNVWCAGGAVYSDDLTSYAYCLPGEAQERCSLGGAGHGARVATCDNGCANGALHWFETFEEHDAFEPTTLCAP